MDSLLDTFALQRRLMARERSEANVSLARNLGHDLTNIIATSKLDLMALGKLAERYEAARPSEAEAEMMRETVDSLQRNARFMQEVVNIYRSFSYLKRPAYETLDARALLDEIADVFLLSTGMAVRLERRHAPGLPAIQGEPRLLKLALFNILNNALDALKRSDRDSGGARRAARIAIGASPAPGGNGVEIIVEDNGPGLRDKDGRLVPPEELGRIFALGYTTKPDSEGEGLGLNWAQTIARDFHGGRIVAENVPSGGARFRLELPLQLPSRAEIPNIGTTENGIVA
jgi:two-component system NtrC family sensor kinase